MSSNLNYKHAANVERRTWDKEAYEARAKARLEASSESSSAAAPEPSSAKSGEKRSRLGDDEEQEKEEFTAADPGAAGPEKSQRAFLKARQEKVDLDSKVGTTEIVAPDAAANTGTGGSITDGVTKLVSGMGWHCKVCDCFLKDSMTYLDHINGRKHQRKLGYSMRVEKSTKEEVLSKLSALAKSKEEQAPNGADAVPVDFEDTVKAKDEEAAKKKAERARRREERKRKEQEEQEEAEGIDPDMAAIMGFGGFAGGNKNR